MHTQTQKREEEKKTGFTDRFFLYHEWTIDHAQCTRTSVHDTIKNGKKQKSSIQL